MIHGSELELDIRDPAFFSNAQKKSVLFGWLARLTGMLPAKLVGSVKPTLGSADAFTEKSDVVEQYHK